MLKTPSNKKNGIAEIKSKNILPLTLRGGNKAEIKGITWVVNDDGSVTVNGTATAVSDFWLFGTWNKTDRNINVIGTLTASISQENQNILMRLVKDGTTTLKDIYTSSIFEISENTKITGAFLRINEGVSVSNVTIYPQLEYGSNVSEFNRHMYYGIVESGDNANGNYIKFSDGTMICTVSMRVTDQPINTKWGSLYTGTRVWTFPVEFIANPVVTCDQFKYGSQQNWGSIHAIEKTNTTLRGYDILSREAGDPVYISATAIGKWK